MRLGVFLPNWIGDVVMATPAIRALRKLVERERGRLVGVMRPYVADVLGGSCWFDDVIYYDKPNRGFTLGTRDLYQALRQAELDRVVLLTNSLRTAWMAWRSGARQRIGYCGDMRAWLLTTRLRRERPELPTIDGYLKLAAAAGADFEPPRLELATTDADEAAADRVWQRLGLPPGKRVVVLNTGAAYGAAKQWPVEHCAALARRLASEAHVSVLVNCGPAEREVAREVVARAAHRGVVGLAGFDELPIGLTKASVRRSRLVVSTDSGPRFFGVAFGKPVVALFGPTDPRATATHYDREVSLSLGLDCQPCRARSCPLVHHRCMRELTVDRVFDAVLRALQHEPVRGAA